MPAVLAKLRWWWLAGALVLAAVAAALLLRGRVPTEAAAAVAAPLVRTLQFSARVATLSRVEVGSTVTGRVAQVLVREGDQVRAGQLLVQLEDDEARAALAQAVASERQAQARLAGLRSTVRSTSAAQLGQAEATLANAQAELRRAEQLVAQGFVSASRADEARRVVEVARAQREAAVAQSQAASERGADLQAAQAQIEAAHAASDAARVRLTQARIVAPADAKVLQRTVEPGQIVQPGKALLGLALAGPTQVLALVDERFLQQLRVGQAAGLVADAYPQQRLAARVLAIAPEVDPAKGAVEVRLALQAPPPEFLREDMTLSVEVVTGERARALVVPARAVRSVAAADGTPAEQVLLAQDGRAVARPVRTGLRTLDAVEVVDGLREGEQVLLAPTVAAGQRVRVRTVAWAPARSGSSAATVAGPTADPLRTTGEALRR